MVKILKLIKVMNVSLNMIESLGIVMHTVMIS